MILLLAGAFNWKGASRLACYNILCNTIHKCPQTKSVIPPQSVDSFGQVPNVLNKKRNDCFFTSVSCGKSAILNRWSDPLNLSFNSSSIMNLALVMQERGVCS